MEWAKSSAPTRSMFVSVVAWIYIALDGFGAFIALIQNILINTVFPFDQMSEGLAQAEARSAIQLPSFFFWMFDHLRPFLLLFLVFTLIKLVSAIGLLYRRNWARLVFIGLLVFGIVGSFAGIALQQYMLSSMLTMPPPRNAPADFEAAMRGMMIVFRVFGAVLAIGFSVLYGWMIKKLMSPPIVAEFS
jgi:hypothetical protein